MEGLRVRPTRAQSIVQIEEIEEKFRWILKILQIHLLTVRPVRSQTFLCAHGIYQNREKVSVEHFLVNYLQLTVSCAGHVHLLRTYRVLQTSQSLNAINLIMFNYNKLSSYRHSKHATRQVHGVITVKNMEPTLEIPTSTTIIAKDLVHNEKLDCE